MQAYAWPSRITPQRLLPPFTRSYVRVRLRKGCVVRALKPTAMSSIGDRLIKIPWTIVPISISQRAYGPHLSDAQRTGDGTCSSSPVSPSLLLELLPFFLCVWFCGSIIKSSSQGTRDVDLRRGEVAKLKISIPIIDPALGRSVPSWKNIWGMRFQVSESLAASLTY